MEGSLSVAIGYQLTQSGSLWSRYLADRFAAADVPKVARVRELLRGEGKGSREESTLGMATES
jgi:hypothetical protein